MSPLLTHYSYLSVGPKASLSRWRCSLWSLGASRDHEQERSWVAFGPWWGEGDSTLPIVAFFTVPPQRAAEDGTVVNCYISTKLYSGLKINLGFN